MNEKINLNQLWADEMNGKVPTGTYHKELLKQYPSPVEDEQEGEIGKIDEKIKEIEEYCRHSYAYFYSSTAKEHVLCLLLHIHQLESQLIKKDMKCPFYDGWDYTCKMGGDLCFGDECKPESCDVYRDGERKTMPKDKLQEAMIIAKIRVMATESLSPDLYEELVMALNEISKTRHINNEILAERYIELSGKEIHASDCDTSCAPAEIPGPCNCNA